MVQRFFGGRRFGWSILAIAWFVLMLACNIPLADPPTPLVPPTRAAEEPGDATPLPAATATQAGAPTADAPTPGPTSTGSFQPAATATSRSTPDPDAPTPTPALLQLSYRLTWTLDLTNQNFALATVELTATGGDGNYRFFRDDIPTGGANFVYRWGACRANPGSFRVESGDGQTARLNYYEQPPCP